MVRIVAPDSTEGRKLLRKLLANYRRRFEYGDEAALLSAAETIILFSSAPAWLKDSFLGRLLAWRMHKVRSLDAAFKIERERKHGADQRIREELRGMVVRAVMQRCRDRISRKAAFKAVAAELSGRSAAWVEGLFYERASLPWRKLFGDPALKAVLRKSRD